MAFRGTVNDDGPSAFPAARRAEVVRGRFQRICAVSVAYLRGSLHSLDAEIGAGCEGARAVTPHGLRELR